MVKGIYFYRIPELAGTEQAKQDLKDYVRQDKLIITAVAKYNEATERAEVKQFGNRLGIEDFR
ncbi:MAG: hypothetical protein NZM13_08750, partial [Cyclobacteriaceae bacterium]|nr:hypothetical protein [Cyclobacteriaceae bacterium]